MSATSPIRFPDVSSPAVMTARAWWLVVLNVFIPGSAQVLAGNRRLGRFGLGATIMLWVLALLATLVYFLARPVLYAVATSVVALWAAQVILAFYAVLWVVLTLDTLRLVRFVKTSQPARSIISVFAAIMLVVVAGTAGYGVVVSGSARGLVSEVFTASEVAEPVDGRYNILLLGGDAGPDRMGLRPDSISVVSIEAVTGKATMMGIPRNLQRTVFSEGSPLYGPYPNGYDCGVECLVSYLYTYGEEHPELYPDAVAHGSSPGIEAMRDAVEGVLGIQLQYYVLIDMQGFSDLIDALGGVTIESTGRYPIGGFEDANGQPTAVIGWVEPGVQQMDGFTALWYARARHGTSDYDRMQRQRQVQTAILAQFEPANVLIKFEGIARAGAQVVKTDIPQGTLGRFVELAGLARAQPIATIELVPANGVDVIHPDFAAIHELVAAALVLTTATPTPTP